MLPHPFDRICLWRVRRLKHQDDIAGNLQAFRSVCTRLIQLQDENTVLVLLTHQIQKHLKTIAVEVSELVKEVRSGGWFDNAVQIGGLELPLHFAFGLDAP